jgi:hypothetical protein
MNGTAMPEASVDENRHPDSTENKVWANPNVSRSNWMVPAITQSAAVEDGPYFQLWTGIPPSISTTRCGRGRTAWDGIAAAHELLP